MKIKYILIAIIFPIFMFSCQKDSTPVIPELKHLNFDYSGEKTVIANNEFAINLFKKTVITEDDNMMISPLSISLALAMTYNGAAGQTKTAMEQAMSLNDLTPHEINNSFKILSDYLQNVDPTVTMKIANSIWYKNSFEVLQNFQDTNSYYYNSLIRPVDFSDSNTKNIMNDWVADNTNNKIKNIVEEIKGTDVMFLINAVYFLGDWTNKFDPAKTRVDKFKLANGTLKDVDMMQIIDEFKYGSNDSLQIIELPYGYDRFSMVLIKPCQGHNVNEIVNSLSTESFESWLNLMNNGEVVVKIPKFKFEYEKKLNDILSDMGMSVAFSGLANFSNINSEIPLYISRVKHKTYIDVNEKGTEAAAATSVVIGVGCNLPSSFIADEPFIFIIREKESNAMIFMGKVENPEY